MGSRDWAWVRAAHGGRLLGIASCAAGLVVRRQLTLRVGSNRLVRMVLHGELCGWGGWGCGGEFMGALGQGSGCGPVADQGWGGAGWGKAGGPTGAAPKAPAADLTSPLPCVMLRSAVE